MRKIFVAALAASMLFAMSASAFANPNRIGTLEFFIDDDAVEEDAGTWEVFLNDDVSIVAAVTQTGDPKDANLYACMLGTTHVAAATCAGEAAEATWVVIASSPGGSVKTITYSDVDTGTAGIFGYRVADTEGNGSAVKDLTVTDPTPPPGGDELPHNACKGIENALSKVKDNKGKAKLAELAEDKFNC